MGNLSNRSIHSVFGVPSRETTVMAFTAASSGVELETEIPAGSKGEIYRLIADEDCHIVINSGEEDATTSDMLLSAGVPEMFSTSEAQWKINVIRKDTDGNLYITRMGSRGR